MNESLTAFIAHAREKGMDHSTIRTILLSAGWKEKEVAEALTSESLSMPVPVPPDVGGAREAFFHLLSFVALYTTTISLIVLFFQYINRLLPDAAFENVYAYDSSMSLIRWSLAAVIVSYPLLVWMSRLIRKDIAQHPEKAWSGIRRWLTYLTLFVAATTVMVDIITLLFTLLEGEMTLRFLLKTLTIFLLVGSVFAYYFLSLRETDQEKLNTKFLYGTIAIVGIALVWGLMIVGSPASERLQKFDERRVEDLKKIESEIHNIVYDLRSSRPYPAELTIVNPIPETLVEVQERAEYTRPSIHDPETSSLYDFVRLSDTRYELCAVFNKERKEQFDVSWNHPSGRHCFDFELR